MWLILCRAQRLRQELLRQAGGPHCVHGPPWLLCPSTRGDGWAGHAHLHTPDVQGERRPATQWLHAGPVSGVGVESVNTA